MALKEAAGNLVIELPRDQVWNKLRDLSLAHNYVAGVAAVRIDTDQREGVGASRTVIMENGSELQETVVEWTDGHGFLIRLHKGDRPAMPIFRRFYFRYHVEDEGQGTRFKPALLHETRFGFLGALLGKLAHGQLKQSAQDVGLAMREYYMTGQRVTPGRLKQLRSENRVRT